MAEAERDARSVCGPRRDERRERATDGARRRRRRASRRVADAFAANFTEHGDIGAACCVYRRRSSRSSTCGAASPTATTRRPWERDTSSSRSRPRRASPRSCANQLIERGRLDPDAPVAEYWPEFAGERQGRDPGGDGCCRTAPGSPRSTSPISRSTTCWRGTRSSQRSPRRRRTGSPARRTATTRARTVGSTGEIVRRVTGRHARHVLRAGDRRVRSASTSASACPSRRSRGSPRLYPPVYEDPELARSSTRCSATTSTLLGRVMSGPSGLFGYDDMWNTRPTARRARCRRRTGTATRARWRGCTPRASATSTVFACSHRRRPSSVRPRCARAASTACSASR